MMQKSVATLLLSAAMFGLLGTPHTAFTQSAREAAATRPAAGEQGQLPVRQVVLYSSGVGYFEHFGSVNGNGKTELRFKTQQINDILKSLILQDMDKGKVGVITYPSQDPIAKTLRSFQVDITNNPSLAELMNQLRGAAVTVTLGAEKATGTILGVERKTRPVGGGEGAKVVELAMLNLLTDAGIRSLSLDDVQSFELQDPKLKEELNRALSALAAARDQDTKPVQINFQGEGERRLRIGYVVETPVWKTSYRLLVSDKVDDAKPNDKPNLGKTKSNTPEQLERAIAELQLVIQSLTSQLGGPNHPVIVNRKKELTALRAELADVKTKNPGAGGGSLQGWAIVENQTDNDWTDVQLSLVSGRPISFMMDLYQPLYIPRPVVQPELYASLRPQTYDGAIPGAKPTADFAAAKAPAAPAPVAAMSSSAARGASANSPQVARLQVERYADQAPMDPAASVSSIASATKVGELFQYTVGNVSLPRQTSAMIPVVTDPVEVEKLSIYNPSVLAKNPLLGARVKNTTGKHLLQGPLTVIDGGSYAGDARIEDLPPGQERLISYGVDQQVLVQSVNNKNEGAIQAGKIVNGVLQLNRKLVASQEYVADNKSDKAKTLIIEHGRRPGWNLVAPEKADETTDLLYRFKGSVTPDKATRLTVKEERVTSEAFAIINIDDETLVAFRQNGQIDQAVRDALTKAAQYRQALAETQRQMQERQQQIEVITTEQNRIRENLKTVSQNTDYSNRLLKKLSDQESKIETLQKEQTDLQKTRDDQRKEMEEYLKKLNVG